MHFSVLGSGSAGNCSLVSSGDHHLLVDAGLSATQIRQRLAGLGLEPEQISGVLITHEHQDHCRGLEVLLKKCPVPVFTSALTTRLLREQIKTPAAWKPIEAGSRFRFGPWEVESFSVPHDAVDPLGFVLRTKDASLGYLTDLGHINPGILRRLEGLHSLYVEANYDDLMLQQDEKRPWATKQRISSTHGHLSNLQAAELCASLAHAGMERIVLGHLSQDCNGSEVAVEALQQALRAAGYAEIAIHCATQDEATRLWPVRERRAAADREMLAMSQFVQLELFG
jgi:phosphoribosyl 1,2-cyclic phosphodiesterase